MPGKVEIGQTSGPPRVIIENDVTINANTKIYGGLEVSGGVYMPEGEPKAFTFKYRRAGTSGPVDSPLLTMSTSSKDIFNEVLPVVTIHGNLIVEGTVTPMGGVIPGARRLEEETDELRDTVAQLRIDLQAATAALQAQGAALDAATAALRAHGLLGAAA